MLVSRWHIGLPTDLKGQLSQQFLACFLRFNKTSSSDPIGVPFSSSTRRALLPFLHALAKWMEPWHFYIFGHTLLLLKQSGIDHDLIYDFVINNAVKRDMRGGITMCSTRHAKTNNPTHTRRIYEPISEGVATQIMHFRLHAEVRHSVNKVA